MPTLESRITRRRAADGKYTRLLAGLDLKLPVEANFARHVYRAYLIMVATRDRVRDHLAERGVAIRVYYSPALPLHPVYTHMGFGPGSFPATERAGEQMVGCRFSLRSRISRSSWSWPPCGSACRGVLSCL